MIVLKIFVRTLDLLKVANINLTGESFDKTTKSKFKQFHDLDCGLKQ